ncbi:potassium channel family protein [Anaerobium acetethylicum]|uniref:Trk system potassium uptake protein TrkA n=1 Tax=Anaerobium acetethylicum TaxID=1619234 RepID=A0A1D3TQ59_9FIRM|nr:TrkA family potassium uptake protein [Anaerobium acetethylicum]SCP95652.1 trk system potassium uptake protein TrkA [Anaerobium acetethylicum]
MYIIIIGCGRLGSNLAKGLADDGNDICIIDRDADKLNALGSGFNGQRIKGIEFDRDILMEAGVQDADAVLAVTPDDNINITISLIVDKIFKVNNVISRVNDPGKKTIYNQLGINTIDPIQYELEILKNKLLIENMEVLSSLDNNYEIIELLVYKEKHLSVMEIEERYKCIISAIVKEGRMGLPQKNEIVRHGDRIVCTVQKKDKGRLINSFGKEILI